MFSINFTKAQAEQYIKERLSSNFINVPEFTVNISVSISDVESAKEATEESSGNTLEVNPWLIPDADGWFTHNTGYLFETAPDYVDRSKEILVVFRDGDVSKCSAKVWDYDWEQTGETWDIAKWKYVD